jgi:hypothetical protein
VGWFATGAGPPYRLSGYQREQLSDFVQLADRRQLRCELGLIEGLIGTAVGGRELQL